ncbi:hypothetical protein CKAN_02087000 [Cinnamomum micranthum f. kanehirae]|uniref:Uncharacterized protein n=1 Tax=Cinnamomum micranthum f. kanehirae TaxID=337451 RepID=A0A443PLQ1_9MAGN|nr:hypothetical protein CKAN_02087000 [Cinnamomum micranthum f. kanehirae]
MLPKYKRNKRYLIRLLRTSFKGVHLAIGNLRYSLVILGYKSLPGHFLASRLLSFVIKVSWVLRKLCKQVLGKG